MRILICDDDPGINEILFNGIKQKYDDFEISVCESAAEMKRLCLENDYDLAFVDIVLDKATDDGTGITAAAELCRNNRNMRVVFITAYLRRFAESIFNGIRPYGYLGKPVMLDKVYYYIDRLESEKQIESGVLEINQGKLKLSIPFGEIYMIESVKRKLHITCPDEPVDFYGKLSDIETRLDERFIRCHQSYIVNADFVSDITNDEIIMSDGAHVVITRKYRPAARQQYFRYKGRNVL